MSGLGWSCRLFSIDLRSLALFRIGVAAILLFDFLSLRLPHVDAYYANEGMFSLAQAVEWHGDSGRWSLCLIDGLADYQAGLLCLAALFSFLLLVGWRTRWMTIACWVMAISIGNRNPFVCNYGDIILRDFLFWSMFLPLGAKWSLDARRLRGADRGDSSQHVCSVASAAALLQLSFIYFFAAIWKWNDAWLDGTAAETALQLEYARRNTFLDQYIYTPLLKPLTFATLVLELLGPLVVWIPWRTSMFRYGTIAAFVLLHFSIEILFTPVLLSYICVVAWFLFLPSGFWECRWARRVLRNSSGDPTKAPFELNKPMVGMTLHGRRIANGLCLVLLLFVFLLNLSTLPSERLGFLIPERLRWIGNVTMLGQKWDMFYRPSTHNGWHKARASLENGNVVDVLRGGATFEPELLESNWPFFQSVRGKLFFRRLGTWDELESLGDPVAEYLRLRWTDQHSDSQQAVKLSLLYYERFDDPLGGGFSAKKTGSAAIDDGPDWDSIFNPMDALMSEGYPN